MRKLLFAGTVALGLVAFGTSGRGEEAKAPPRQYHVVCRIATYGQDGKRTALVMSEATTEEGKECSFLQGNSTALPAVEGKIKFLDVGTMAQVVVTAAPGDKVRLEAAVESSWIEPTRKSKLHIRTDSMRSIETLGLGETLRCELAADSETGSSRVVEIKVEVAPPPAPSAIGLNR